MIFGLFASKFVDSTTGQTVSLDYASVTEHRQDFEYDETRSEIDGSRRMSLGRSWWTVIIAVNLWKFADPLATFTLIVASLKKAVTLWLHSDGYAFPASAGGNATFILSEIVPVALGPSSYKDSLILRFESETVGTILPPPEIYAYQPYYVKDEDGNQVQDVDDDGRPIWVRV